MSSSDWAENLPPFSYTETESESEILSNAKRKIRSIRKHKISLWSLFAFLSWKQKISNADSINRAFTPGQKVPEPEQTRKHRSPIVRNQPYFWEVWFPITSTLTLSPLLIWETDVPSSLFQDCLPESVLPVGEPGKWKIRIHSMRVLSHQLGSLYEDYYPSPHIVYRTEVWVYGHKNVSEIDPENPLLFPLGVWVSPDFLREEDPRLRTGLHFQTGETYWKIQGEQLNIGIRGQEWTWKPARENKNFPKELESPHIALGKTYFSLESVHFNRNQEIAYLFKRAIISDPSLLQRSKPKRKRS